MALYGTLLKRLQETSIFPPTIGYPAVLADMPARLTETGLFADGLLEPHRAGFERIRDAYRWDDSARVSSHNDPHPGNMRFDGRRLRLIDWETAYRNDPIVDVAVTTLYLASSSQIEEALLRSWLGRPPDALLRARLVLMRQLVKLFYGMTNGLYVAAARPGLIETSLAAPTPPEFRSAIDEGRLVPKSLEAQQVGGKVALRAFVAGLETASFADALDVVQRA
jgi:hypothetical protein